MEFKCSNCDYVSPYKNCTLRHINKKYKCGPNPSIIEIEGETKCMYCNRPNKTIDNLNQHLKICKVRSSDIELENLLLKKEIEILKNIKTVINSNSNNNINTVNNFTTVQLRPYNDPRLPDDMDDIFEDAWEKQRSIPTYIERVHFSDEYPENHNMCITNLRSKYSAKVFNGKTWETRDQDELTLELYHMYGKKLDNWVKCKKKRIERYKDYMHNNDEDTSIGEMKIMLYDTSKNGIVNIKSNVQYIKYIN